MTPYRQTLYFSLPVVAFIIFGAISVASLWPLCLVPLPFLFAWLIQCGLNNPVLLQDAIDDKRFGSLLAKIDVVRLYSVKEETLSSTDIEQLKSRLSDGYQYPEAYILALIANNQKIIYQGYVTSKFVYEAESLITIGKTAHFRIPEGTYEKLTLGDYVILAVAFARISGLSRPTFVLSCEIVKPAEELEA